jgi:type VI secretion system protein VasJ
MPVQIQEIPGLGSDPIGDGNPAGDTVRYDAEFEQLSAEIAKMESIQKDVKVDWGVVVQLSFSILKSKSKDYRVASYLLMALYETEKVGGLLLGLRMYDGLIRTFWETGFPERSRLRGRIGALEWLSGHLGNALSRDSRKPVSDELVLELDQAIRDFSSALTEFLGEQAPAFTEVQAAVDTRVKDVRTRKAAAERDLEDEARRAAAVASGEVTEVADAEKVIEECRERLFRVADFFYGSDPTAPLSYRLRRSITWGWVVSIPINENEVTQIPPLPADLIQKCSAFSAEGKWLEIVEVIESRFIETIFAFDLQRLCIQALVELGPQYDSARQTILCELVSLLTRLPEISKLKFNDGSLFTDAQTTAWIHGEVLGGASQVNSPIQRGAAAEGSESVALTEAIAEARTLMSSGKLQDAIALVKDGIAKSPLRRFRFLWRLHLAKLCIEAGKLQLALPQLLSLDEEVGRFSLEEWEPGLSLEVVQNLFVCRQKLAATMQTQSADAENQLAQLYQRLCKLDVNAALAVEF